MPDEVKWLQKFLGKWTSAITYTNEKNEVHKYPFTMEFRSTAGGWGLFAIESANDPKMGEMSGTDLLGFDPYEKKLHCYTVDNMGTCHDHICEWKAPDHFYMEHNSMRDGKKYQEKIDLRLKSTDVFEFNITSSLDGKQSESSIGTFKRAK